MERERMLDLLRALQPLARDTLGENVDAAIAELTRPAAVVVEGVVRCPKCGGDELSWEEEIVSVRTFHGLAGGVLRVDDVVGEDDPGGCTGADGRLFCNACLEGLDYPEGLSVEFADTLTTPS